MIVIGVDPGINGAIAVYSTVSGLLERSKLPTVGLVTGKDAAMRRKVSARELRELVSTWSRRHAFAGEYVLGVIERMQPFPRAGPNRGTSPSSLLSLGHTAGLVEGVISAWCREILTPMPQQWKRGFGLTSKKATSVAECRRRFGITVGHDQAEAILLAVWGLGQVNGPALEVALADHFEAVA